MLTTKDKVKSLLGITGSSDDTFIDELIANFSAFVEAVTNRKISQVSITQYFNGGETNIFLSNLPVISLTSLKQNIGTQAVPNWQTIAAGDYTIYFNTGLIRHVSVFPSGSRNIEAVYSTGFVTIPDDLELLCKQLVARMFEQRRAQGKSNENIGEGGVGWTTVLTEEQKAIISKYRKYHV